ncbi:hypothetical protein BOW14_12865 [Solemya velum gill symbiont]|nr:hypothetical protein BOW14_12865 [Solemya velum gill symbiont]
MGRTRPVPLPKELDITVRKGLKVGIGNSNLINIIVDGCFSSKVSGIVARYANMAWYPNENNGFSSGI